VNLDLQFDFLVDEANNTITVRREFAAKRPLVWDCYTRSELLDRWFAPKPMSVKTSHMDFREGGYWHYAMVSPDGQEFWGRMDYLTIQPIDRFTSLDGFCDAAGELNPQLPRASWDATFRDVSDHCLVQTVVTYGSAEDVRKVVEMGLRDGLASSLERLDELLARLAR
jgi:uncharacterized protein YndB with AHSA1/START domain